MSRMAEHYMERLEYLRGELRAERISYGELAELQGMAWLIPPDDVELLEAAGVPECCAWTWPERCSDHDPMTCCAEVCCLCCGDHRHEDHETEAAR